MDVEENKEAEITEEANVIGPVMPANMPDESDSDDSSDDSDDSSDSDTPMEQTEVNLTSCPSL